MRRYDLAFFMCCCKSFLGNPHNNSDSDGSSEGIVDYYHLLNIEKDASIDEIKRAYKKQSLLMHPDKLSQRGLAVTEADQTKFTKMKEAYEILSDPMKRETYDTIGLRGMKYMEEPFNIDPQELAHNFAKSNILDRSKIFAIFVVIVIIVLLQPILICLHVDGDFGPNASWMATLVPLWIWNFILILYHTHIILMGPIQKPDHIPDHEWVDPLPMHKRKFSMFRFVLIVLFEIFIALKLDHEQSWRHIPWSVLFIPLYVWEVTTIYKKYPLAKMRIVTVDHLEAALGKPFSEFTTAEKEVIGKHYSVVSSISCPEFDIASKLKARAKQDIMKSLFRIIFVILLLVQLDNQLSINWYLIFIPFWIMSIVICYSNYQSYVEVTRMAKEKDPTLFSYPNNTHTHTTTDGANTTSPIDIETGKPMYSSSAGTTTDAYSTTQNTTTSNYDFTTSGTIPDPLVGGSTFQMQQQQQQQSNTTSAQQQQQQQGQSSSSSPIPPQPVPEITEEEREELKAQVMTSSSRLCSKCCSQGFILLLLILFVAKLQGAKFSSFLIISPFLAIAGIILCCLGFAIFGVTEVPTDGIDFENAEFSYANAEQGTSAPNVAAATTTSATASTSTSTQGIPGTMPSSSPTNPNETTTDNSNAYRSMNDENMTPQVTPIVYVPPLPTPSPVVTTAGDISTRIIVSSTSVPETDVINDVKRQPTHLNMMTEDAIAQVHSGVYFDNTNVVLVDGQKVTSSTPTNDNTKLPVEEHDLD